MPTRPSPCQRFVVPWLPEEVELALEQIEYLCRRKVCATRQAKMDGYSIGGLVCRDSAHVVSEVVREAILRSLLEARIEESQRTQDEWCYRGTRMKELRRQLAALKEGK